MLIATTFLAIGALLGLALAPAAPPGPIGESQRSGSISVHTEEFYDERQVELAIVMGPERRLLAPAPGVVTRLACEPGATIDSGSSPVSLNGTPLVVLATPVPLWRDLAVGTSGADVEALQQELLRQGFQLAETGRYDTATQRAVSNLMERAGAATNGGGLQLDSIVWIPDRTITIASCETELGAIVDQGTPLASVEPEIETATIPGIASDLARGKRELIVDNVSVTTDETGMVSEPSDLEALAGTEAFLHYRRTDGAVPVTGTYRLADPLTVTSVPAAAIVTGPTGRTCVLADDSSTYDVRVVASVVGRTLIEWVVPTGGIGMAETPLRVRINPGDDLRC